MRGRIVGHGAGARYFVEGRPVSKEEFDRAFPPVPAAQGRAAGLVGFRPLASDALAVHPRQVGEAAADALAKGVPTEFLPDGRPVLRTRQHRKAYMRAYGFYDRDAGYGDAQPGSFRGEAPPG